MIYKYTVNKNNLFLKYKTNNCFVVDVLKFLQEKHETKQIEILEIQINKE